MSTDPRAFLAVVYLLGAALLLDLLVIGGLAYAERDVPEVLPTILVGCLTGLAGLLARTPTDARPAPVVVQQPDSDPVPVEQAPPAPAQHARPTKRLTPTRQTPAQPQQDEQPDGYGLTGL